MPTFDEPAADAAEAQEALRALAHATRAVDDPATCTTCSSPRTRRHDGPRGRRGPTSSPQNGAPPGPHHRRVRLEQGRQHPVTQGGVHSHRRPARGALHDADEHTDARRRRHRAPPRRGRQPANRLLRRTCSVRSPLMLTRGQQQLLAAVGSGMAADALWTAFGPRAYHVGSESLGCWILSGGGCLCWQTCFRCHDILRMVLHCDIAHARVDVSRRSEGGLAMWDTVQTNELHISHDLPCPRCGHALHPYLACSDACDCPPVVMPGTLRRAA